MICCVDCFNDNEVKAAIELIGHRGNCSICGSLDTWIFDSDLDEDESIVKDMLEAIIEIYVPESELPYTYPTFDTKSIAERLCDEWGIFSGTPNEVFEIVKGIVENSLFLNEKILVEPVGIPQLYDEEYLLKNSIMKNHTWGEFKKSLRNVNRFHSDYINLELLEEILKVAQITIPLGERFFRARVSNEKGSAGFSRKEMWAPPDDVASPDRANSKGQSCLYLCSRKKTTVKEIRAHAFDYVTIATFKLNRNIKVLDLCSIAHNSPFYNDTDKVDYLINEQILRAIERDLAKPMSRWDSELDYLPTQYISDFAKFCGYDGVRYYSTFDRDAYNIALFDSSVCSCIYHRNFLVGDLDYKITAI
ncbi:MAG TPA: RES family NAD+ phosphorylase [Lachnospiraceae bacterium]